MESAKAFAIQESDPRLQGGGVLAPVGERIWRVDARGREDGVPEAADGGWFRFAGKNEPRPGGRGGGDDGPVNFVARDEFERRAHGFGSGEIGARHLTRIFGGEQGRIAARDGETRCPASISGRDTFLQPIGGAIKAFERRVMEAHQGGFFVREQGRHQASACFVSMFGQAANERESIKRRGHDEFLTVRETEAGVDGYFGELVELRFES